MIVVASYWTLWLILTEDLLVTVTATGGLDPVLGVRLDTPLVGEVGVGGPVCVRDGEAMGQPAVHPRAHTVTPAHPVVVKACFTQSIQAFGSCNIHIVIK